MEVGTPSSRAGSYCSLLSVECMSWAIAGVEHWDGTCGFLGWVLGGGSAELHWVLISALATGQTPVLVARDSVPLTL